MYDLLTHFPAAWAIVGMIITATLFPYIFRYQREALKSYREFMAERLRGVIEERNSYRDQLHLERTDCNVVKMRCKELEMRPDYTDLQTILEGQSRVLYSIKESFEAQSKQIGDSFQAHSKEDAEAFGKIIAALDKVSSKLDRKAA